MRYSEKELMWVWIKGFLAGGMIMAGSWQLDIGMPLPHVVLFFVLPCVVLIIWHINVAVNKEMKEEVENNETK